MNKFADFFYNVEKKNLVFKWVHYFDIYEKHFSRLIGKSPVILEIGVAQGGSIDMWNHYFDGDCTIYAIDIDPRCKRFEKDNVKIFIGDQGDPNFWEHFKENVPKLDLVLDDGGHKMNQQITTYECLFDHIKDDGTYMCEDTHTSYMPNYGGGVEKPGTFIEYTKKLIDLLHVYHADATRLVPSFRKKAHSITFYDSIVVIEKKRDEKRPVSIAQRPIK